MRTTLLVSYSAVMGGAERALIQFAQGLDGERWLACPPGPLAASAQRSGVRVAPLRARRIEFRGTFRDTVATPLRIAAHGRELHRLVKHLGPDLIVACGMRPLLGLTLEHDSTAALVFLHNDFLPLPPLATVIRRAARRADLTIVPSNAVAQDLDLPVTVIAPGVAPEFFDGIREAAQPPQILVLGALVPWKRPGFALEVLALARRQVPGLGLRIAGSRVSDDSDIVVQELAARLADPDLHEGVELLGSVSDPAAELRRALCLLHCATREPFGLAVAEALATGTPAVVPAGGGPAEIVAEGAGIAYPPEDPAAAARAIVAIARDPVQARRLGRAGRERARQRYTEVMAQQRFARSIAALEPPPVPAQHLETTDWAIVTVTHNSASELEQLLSSVERHAPEARVIVVDNASEDASVRVAATWGERTGRLETVALAQNIGFGPACNQGLERVREQCVALLNPDVELLDDSLRTLIARAANSSENVLLGPLVLSADASRQHSAHPLPCSAGDRVHALIPPAVLPARLAAATIAPWRSSTERRAGWLVGCAIVAATTTLRRLGPFDEQIFLYGEDLDLGLRAQASGVEVRFCPQARVLHHGAHASTRAFGGEPFAVLARARADAVRRNLGHRAASADTFTQAATFASRALLKALARRPTQRERAQLSALRAARRSSFGARAPLRPRPSSPA